VEDWILPLAVARLLSSFIGINSSISSLHHIHIHNYSLPSISPDFKNQHAFPNLHRCPRRLPLLISRIPSTRTTIACVRVKSQIYKVIIKTNPLPSQTEAAVSEILSYEEALATNTAALAFATDEALLSQFVCSFPIHTQIHFSRIQGSGSRKSRPTSHNTSYISSQIDLSSIPASNHLLSSSSTPSTSTQPKKERQKRN